MRLLLKERMKESRRLKKKYICWSIINNMLCSYPGKHALWDFFSSIAWAQVIAWPPFKAVPFPSRSLQPRQREQSSSGQCFGYRWIHGTTSSSSCHDLSQRAAIVKPSGQSRWDLGPWPYLSGTESSHCQGWTCRGELICKWLVLSVTICHTFEKLSNIQRVDSSTL